LSEKKAIATIEDRIWRDAARDSTPDGKIPTTRNWDAWARYAVALERRVLEQVGLKSDQVSALVSDVRDRLLQAVERAGTLSAGERPL
jgi:hypothetical protein